MTATGGVHTIDRDRAEASFGLQPAWTSAGSLRVSQLLYSDGARARATVEGYVQTSREQGRVELRLDVARGAAVGYLDVLRATTFERIQRENLEPHAVEPGAGPVAAGGGRRPCVRGHPVGEPGRHQPARRHRGGGGAEHGGVALNRLLNRPLEEPFRTAEVDLNDPALLANAATVEEYVRNPFAFAIFRDFMTREALAQSPELRQLDAAIAAQERTVLAARRSFWAPTVAATGDLSTVKTAAGLGGPGGPDLPFDLPRANALNWTVGVSASLPLFNGGALRAERSRAEVQLDELRVTRRAAAERIELRLRSVLFRAGAS